MRRPVLLGLVAMVGLAIAFLVVDWMGEPEAPPAAAPTPPDPATIRRLEDASARLATGTPGGLVLAADLYRQVLATDSLLAEARYGLGRAELGSGRTWAGLWHMLRLLRRHPDHAGGWSALGLGYYGAAEWADVPPPLERLARLRPLDRMETLALADACERVNRPAAAESLYTLVLEETPDDRAVLAARAAARREQARIEDAVADLRRATEGGGRSGPAGFGDGVDLATLLLDLDRADEAEAVLESLGPAGAAGRHGSAADSVRYHVLRARLLDRSGAPRGALHHIDTALAIDSLDVDACYLEARVHRRLGDREGAERAAARHRRAVAEHQFPERVDALTALVQGGIAWEAGDEEAALAAWRDGLTGGPEDWPLHCVIAPVLQRRGERDRARESYGVLRARMGGAPPGPLFLDTGTELRRRGLLRLAAQQFALAADRQPGDERAAFFAARGFAEIADWPRALAAAAPLERSRAGAGRP